MTPSPSIAAPADVPDHAANQGEERRRRDRQRAVVFAILLACFALYVPSVGNDFTWDDRAAAMGTGATAHPLVAQLHAPHEYFASNWWPQHAPSSQAYRPLTTLWFALRHAAVGDHAMVAHLANLLLHTGIVGLAYLLLRRLGAAFVAAAIGSLVFGLHAVHSESVANLVGGAELLALFFGLLATLSLPHIWNGSARRRCAAHVATATFLFAAFASKESGLAWAAFAPLCALLPAWRDLQAPQRVQRLRSLVPIIAVPVAVYLWLRARMIAALPTTADSAVGLMENPLLELDAPARVASALVAWGHGLLQTLLPLRLSVDYGPDQLPVIRDWQDPWLFGAAAAAATFAALLVVAYRSRHRAPLLALGIACFFGFSFITSNVALPVFMHFADRSYTTPSLGLGCAVAWLVMVLPERGWPRQLAKVALGGWLLLDVAVAWPRNFVFSDDATLIVTEVKNSPRSVRLQLCAGLLHLQRQDRAGAREHFLAAAQLAPHLPQAWLELAQLELTERDIAAAQRHFDLAQSANAAERRRFETRLQHVAAQLALASPR